MTTGFRINGTDTDDLFVRKDLFIEGNLWLWGDNTYGQLGDNSTTHRSSPVQTSSGGTDWKLISRRYDTAAGIKTDGTLWVWGRNLLGTIGDNTTIDRSVPVQTISGGTNWRQLNLTFLNIAAIKSDGTLWAWGANGNGQLGDNSVSNKSSPVQTVSGGNNWKQVASGVNFTGAIKIDGTLWTWGDNSLGQLGDNSITHRSSPVQTVSGGNNWKQVSCGDNFTGAIKTDGTLWLWGYNNFGQLGDNSATSRSSPVQTVSGGTNWKQVNCGSFQTAAIKTDGTLWTWGYNFSGQLGDNTTITKFSPVQTIAGGTNWKKVDAGINYMTAIKTDGTLWVWGNNGLEGRLGINTSGASSQVSSPVQTIAGGTNWKLVSAGTAIR